MSLHRLPDVSSMLAYRKVNHHVVSHELPSQDCRKHCVTAYCIVTGMASGSFLSKHTHLIDPPDLSWLLLSCLHEHHAPETAWSNAACPVVPASHIPMLAATHTHTHTHDSHVTVSRWQHYAVPGKRKQCTVSSLT